MNLESPTEEDYLGIYSIIFWTLTLIGVVKYVCIALNADDHGEGMCSVCFTFEEMGRYSFGFAAALFLLTMSFCSTWLPDTMFCFPAVGSTFNLAFTCLESVLTTNTQLSRYRSHVEGVLFFFAL